MFGEITETELVEEIHRAEKLLEYCIPHYWDKEEEAPAELKLVMLINRWTRPVMVCEELLKRIWSNEDIIRRKKIKFSSLGYSSRYKELSFMLQRQKNKQYTMTNKEIIAEVEKTLGVKVVEDVYPDCEYFIMLDLAGNKGKWVFSKMTNSNTEKPRRYFTREEQMQEIKQRCEEIKKICSVK